MKYLLPLCFLLCVSTVFGQQTKTYDNINFSSLVVNSGIEVTLLYGEEYAVSISAPPALLERVEVKQTTKTLALNIKSGVSMGARDESGRIQATITLPRLVAVTANAGARISSDYTWQMHAFKIMSNGGAQISLSLDADRLDATTNGGAKLILAGQANEVKLRANGGASISAFDFTCEQVQVIANGGANVKLNVTDKITGTANGGGTITYRGDPTEENISKNGGGTVKRG